MRVFLVDKDGETTEVLPEDSKETSEDPQVVFTPSVFPLPPIVEVSSEEEASYCVYTVVPGDTLSAIFSRFTGEAGNYKKWMETDSKTSTKIFPGDRVQIRTDLLPEEFRGCQAPLEKPETPEVAEPPTPEATVTPTPTSKLSPSPVAPPEILEKDLPK